jgi:hypothetical protein
VCIRDPWFLGSNASLARPNLGEGGNASNWSHFPRNLAPDLTQYLREQRTEGLKTMNHQDSGTIIMTFLLLLPWLGRAAVSAVAIWREHTETQGRKAKQNF